MKTLNYKTLLTCLISMFVIFSSCQKEELKDEEEKGFIIETECTIDGVDMPVTKAENEKGWTTGDGIYHNGEYATVTANAKSGYELVTFYNKADVSKSNLGSSHKFRVQQNTYFKAEFRSTAPTTYCINCSITGQGSVSGTGCGKTNGTYTLTANPSPGWSSNWTTKQVTVNGADVNTSVTFTKNQEQKNVTVYFTPTYGQNLAPGIVTYAQIRYTLQPVSGGASFYDSGRYPALDLSSRPSLTVPPGTYKVLFSCSNISVRPLNGTGEGQSYGVNGRATYDHPETITITGDTDSETIMVSVMIVR